MGVAMLEGYLMVCFLFWMEKGLFVWHFVEGT
jgi:hypothetical protein